MLRPLTRDAAMRSGGGLSRSLRTHVESALARADLAVVRRSTFEPWLDDGPSSAGPQSPLPPGADATLRADHPRLAELVRRYRDHPASVSSMWSDVLISSIDLQRFRADNAYVWQRRANTRLVHYGLTTFYLQRHDVLGLLPKLHEDGLFGAHTFDIDGLTVSRDLLDSVTELSFLEEELGLSGIPRPTILDIGAGYGRLAHRTTTALEGVTYLCTDAVPLSTFLCEYYVAFRGGNGAEVLPLDDIASSLRGRRIDLAVNVHSFGECPLDAIRWWLELLGANDVANLMIVPNGEELLSKESSGERCDFRPLVEAQGFELVAKRPKYAHSRTVQEQGVYPTYHYLFRRR